jgi:hypothetical protein
MEFALAPDFGFGFKPGFGGHGQREGNPALAEKRV